MHAAAGKSQILLFSHILLPTANTYESTKTWLDEAGKGIQLSNQTDTWNVTACEVPVTRGEGGGLSVLGRPLKAGNTQLRAVCHKRNAN